VSIKNFRKQFVHEISPLKRPQQATCQYRSKTMPEIQQFMLSKFKSAGRSSGNNSYAAVNSDKAFVELPWDRRL
jgi:hypothetical protein